jgi:uncharacterized membrane protein (Fun14 family)
MLYLVLDPFTQSVIIQGVELVVGLLIGYGVARALKGLLLVLVGLLILVLLGITIAGLPNLREALGFLGQLANAARPLLGFVMERPPFMIGLLIGFVMGLIR